MITLEIVLYEMSGIEIGLTTLKPFLTSVFIKNEKKKDILRTMWMALIFRTKRTDHPGEVRRACFQGTWTS